MTHYIPAFTTRYHGQQRAVCGEYVSQARHSVEPTCQPCAAYLTSQAAEDEETALALEAEFPEWKGRLAAGRD